MNEQVSLPNEEATRPEPIYIERDGDVVTFVLNRANSHNAITLDMWNQIPHIMRPLSEDKSIRCIVISGNGGKAFCSGCDIREFAQIRANREQGLTYSDAKQKALEALYDCPHPMIAKVQGICFGAGVEILATCDIRLCSESSTFAIPAKNLGILLTYPELEPIYRLVGQTTLMELLLEGRTLSAREAYAKKLITRVISDEDFLEEVEKSIAQVTQGAPLSAHLHKKFVRRLIDRSPLTAQERDECFSCYETEDYRLGCAAFLLREAPIFKGK